MSDPAPRRRGRRPAGEDTRGAIVAAARTVFAAKGYEAATIRGIARAAGVDPRLVHHYFAGKEDVFVEALQFPVRPAQVIGPVVEPGPDGLGERIVRLFFAAWDGPDQRDRIVALLASAATSPEGARMLREFVVREILGRVVEQLRAPQARLRVELAAAQMIGVAFVRYVVQVEPLASAPVEELVGWLAPTVQRYLTGAPGTVPGLPEELGLPEEPGSAQAGGAAAVVGSGTPEAAGPAKVPDDDTGPSTRL